MNLQGVVLVLVLFAMGSLAQEFEDDFMREALVLLQDCDSKQFSMCIKEKALKYLNNLPSKIDFGGGLMITPTDGSSRTARYFAPVALPVESKAREESLDSILWDRVINFLNGHTFHFKIPDGALQSLKRSFDDEEEHFQDVEEGRKKKKKGGNGLMMLLQLKAAAIGAIMLKVIGFVAFKALMLAKLSLVLVSIIALKKALDQKHGSSSYEIIAHPYEDHGHGHYDRSLDTNLPYRGYTENKNSIN